MNINNNNNNNNNNNDDDDVEVTRKKNYELTYLSFTQKKTNHARDFAKKKYLQGQFEKKNLTLSRLGIPLPLISLLPKSSILSSCSWIQSIPRWDGLNP